MVYNLNFVLYYNFFRRSCRLKNITYNLKLKTACGQSLALFYDFFAEVT